MYVYGLTFEEVRRLTVNQLSFLLAGLDWHLRRLGGRGRVGGKARR